MVNPPLFPCPENMMLTIPLVFLPCGWIYVAGLHDCFHHPFDAEYHVRQFSRLLTHMAMLPKTTQARSLSRWNAWVRVFVCVQSCVCVRGLKPRVLDEGVLAPTTPPGIRLSTREAVTLSCLHWYNCTCGHTYRLNTCVYT